MKPLRIDGAWVTDPAVHPDRRGSFREWFRREEFEAATGFSFPLAQANCSISHPGVIRGIHFAVPGQAKYVACMSGVIFDVIVDLRVGSPTFGQWEAVRLDAADRAVFISEGLGHAFMALPPHDATLMYLCSRPFSPTAEHAVNPLDPMIGIAWPISGQVIMSVRDEEALSLAQALQEGWLPRAV